MPYGDSSKPLQAASKPGNSEPAEHSSRAPDTPRAVLLPPIQRAGEAVDYAATPATLASSPCSPMRKARRAELTAYALGHSPNDKTSAGMLLDLGLIQQTVAGPIAQQEDLGRLALETWVDDMLRCCPLAHTAKAQGLQAAADQSQVSCGAKGAAAVGLARSQLVTAGMTQEAVDHLYRGLFVYSVGFADVLKELLAHNDRRQELLYTIWTSYLGIAELAIKATFRSEYLSLVEAAGTAMAELMGSKHALAEAQRDNAAMVKDLGWLSAAEAEAAAARRGLKLQVEELQASLCKEQKAHQHAVKQYLDALDARSTVQLQWEDTKQQMDTLLQQHTLLNEEHCQLQKQYDTLVGQCKVVRDVCKHVDDALSMDSQLAESMSGQAQRSVSPKQQKAESAPSSLRRSGSVQSAREQHSCDAADQLAVNAELNAADDATDLQPLVERLQQQVEIMYCQWRSALEAKAAAQTENYKLGDELRVAKEGIHQTTEQMNLLQSSHNQLEQQLHHSQATCSELENRLLEAHEAIAKHLLDLAETGGLLQQARNHVDSLEARCTQYEECNRDLTDGLADKGAECSKLEQQLHEAGKKLAWKHRLMAEVSKGFSVAMQSLQSQQTARRVLRRLLEAERRKGAHLGSSLEGKDARLHHLDAMAQEQQHQIAKLQSEVALLEATLTDTQKQAMSLGGRLALSETRNEELTNQIQEQHEQLNEVSSRLNKTATKFELSQSQLDKASKEVKALKEAAEVAERQLADGCLTAKSLKAEVDRLTREKQDLLDRAQATKARLELELNRVSGELDTMERKLELMAADLVAERDKTAGTKTKLERKRGKKRRWKSAYSKSVSEVESLHQQLLGKQKELEAFDTRLRRMETELRMLAVANTIRLPAAVAGLATGKENSRPASANAVLVVDLAAARKAHEAAAADVQDHAQQCLRIDHIIEQVEVAKQQLLLKLAAPEHTEDSIKSLRSALDDKAEELSQLHVQREAIELKRAEAAARTRAAETALREAHHLRLLQRQRLLEQQAMQASDLINAATMSQLEAAEAAELACRSQLDKHLAAFEASQADKVVLGQRMKDLQAGIDTFVRRISELQVESAQLEEKLKRANNVINFLQIEISTLKTEREKLHHNLNERERRISALEAELEKAQQSVSVALKSLEAKHQADKLMQDQKQLADRARSAQMAKSHDAAMAALRSKCNQLQNSLQWMAAEAWALRTGSRHPDKSDVPFGNPSSDQTISSREANAQSSNSGSTESARPNSSACGAGLSCSHVFLSDPGAGGGECVLGARWLYAYQESGPWVATRAALRDYAAGSVTSPGVTPRPEVTSEGVRRLGSPTALLFALPGLSFNPDSLAVLIGELILDKIMSDNRADSQAAAAIAASSVKPSAAVVVDEMEVSSHAHGAVAVKAWWTARNRKDLEGSVYDFFMSRLGGRLAAEAHCSALAFGIRKAAARNKRARLFGRCLGLVEPAIPSAGVAVLMHYVAQLHSLCGPLTGEATEGSSQVLARSAAQVGSELFSSTVAPPVSQVSGLPAAIIDAAGGHRDNSIAMDDVLDLVLEAWAAQHAADARQIETVFRAVDVQGRGVVVCDDFLALLQQMNPGAAATLAPEQVLVLFTSALRASGPGAAAVSASGCAAALLNAGLVGSGAHLLPHPSIIHKPPFSEYRLLHDSWHAVKPAVAELMRGLPKRLPNIASEVSLMTAVVKKLDDSLEGCAPAPEAWQCYRRILGFYSHYGKFVEIATAVFVGGSSSGRSAASSAGTAGEGAACAVSDTRVSCDLLQLSATGDHASRPGSAAVAANADAAGVATPAALPGDSRPSSAGIVSSSLQLPLASALLRPGSSLQRHALSPRVASGNNTASRPASACCPSKS